jgi:prepilin-type N-terminal cleavage/methylation domain-containing protein
MPFFLNVKNKKGFTLVEILVGAFVFLIIAAGVYQGYVTVLRLLGLSEAKTAATLLANERVELVRNLAYQDVGTVGGLPNGVLPQVSLVSRDGFLFTVTTTVRSIDDPFDGTIGGTPNDLSPADYKLVQIEIGCSACRNFTPLSVTTTQAPKNLETSSGNGALFVQVIDGNGQPISGVTVRVQNASSTPPIDVTDLTNQNGILPLVDVPPGIHTYKVTVSKNGYSSSTTYPPGGAGNPNPVKPNATVAAGQVTQLSFAIDFVGTINWRSVSPSCQVRANIPFTLHGTKLLGTNPDTLAYNQNLTTGAPGTLVTTNLEWDTYTFSPISTLYDLAGSSPLLSMTLSPGAAVDALLVLEPKVPKSLLVSVKDGATGLPVADATVTISAGAFNQTLITNRGFLRQTNWSGGSGQEVFSDGDRYLSSDGNIETANPAGDIRLRQSLGTYAPSGEIVSSTFDTGSATTTYYNLLWEPIDQPEESGEDSVRLQLASNNDGSTWNFIGPDGTSASYYTTSNQNINALHNGHQYIRYKVFLGTASSTLSPNISEIALTYGSVCVPYGQVFFQGLVPNTYTVSVSHPNYQPVSTDVVLSEDWKLIEVSLTP